MSQDVRKKRKKKDRGLLPSPGVKGKVTVRACPTSSCDLNSSVEAGFESALRYLTTLSKDTAITLSVPTRLRFEVI